jgi:formylglycine-generating enzyme required for sulfatase activity
MRRGTSQTRGRGRRVRKILRVSDPWVGVGPLRAQQKVALARQAVASRLQSRQLPDRNDGAGEGAGRCLGWLAGGGSRARGAEAPGPEAQVETVEVRLSHLQRGAVRAPSTRPLLLRRDPQHHVWPRRPTTWPRSSPNLRLRKGCAKRDPVWTSKIHQRAGRATSEGDINMLKNVGVKTILNSYLFASYLGVATIFFSFLTVGCRSNATDSATKTEPKSGPEFVRLPGGTFHYGCEPQDTQCLDEEKPGRSVTVAPFWLGKTDVTVAAYARCVSAGSCTVPGVPSAGYVFNKRCNWFASGKDNHPITCVDWDQATAFCQWIGGRLPTEEEWEYAAKGGESRVYPWGNESPDDNHALFGKPYPGDGTGPADAYSAGVSKHGLLNMAGNVWQWTASEGDASANEELRGGSWADYAKNIRASARINRPVASRGDNFGVRCALASDVGARLVAANAAATQAASATVARLEWQNGHSPDQLEFEAAKSYCSGLTGGRWRLPTNDELSALYSQGGVERGDGTPGTDTWYWTSSVVVEDGGSHAGTYAWSLVGGRFVLSSTTKYKYTTRCVRLR